MVKNKSVIVWVLLLLLIPAFIILCLWMFIPQTSDNVIDFLENKYVSFVGGKEAEKFFEKYIDTKNGDVISFQYTNHENKLTLYKMHTLFCVDVKYTKEQYGQVYDKIYSQTDCPDVEKGYNYYGDFLITTIMLDDSVFKENYCGVCFNEKTNTVRYTFLYNVKREQVLRADPRMLIKRSCSKIEW